MSQRRCPDCSVEMADVDLTTHEGFGLGVQTDETREGLLGKLGINERHGVDGRLCPECGLVRLYAELDE